MVDEWELWAVKFKEVLVLLEFNWFIAVGIEEFGARVQDFEAGGVVNLAVLVEAQDGAWWAPVGLIPAAVGSPV